MTQERYKPLSGFLRFCKGLMTEVKDRVTSALNREEDNNV